LHELVAAHVPEDAEPGQVVVGIETDRGPWVQALLASGYQVDAINPMQAARYRERHSTSGAKSDAGDARVLAELVRLDRAPGTARSPGTATWPRRSSWLPAPTRRLAGTVTAICCGCGARCGSSSLPRRVAFDDLTAPDALELLGAAPDPVTPGPACPARASVARFTGPGGVTRPSGQRRSKPRCALGQLGQPPVVTGAYAAIVRSLTAVITALNTQIKAMQSAGGGAGWSAPGR
jgi:hypothetical protein